MHRFISCKRKIERFNAVKINDKSEEEKNNLLYRYTQTFLNSKIIANYKEFLSEMILEAKEKLEECKDKDLIGIKHTIRGYITDSFLVYGVAFKKVSLMHVLSNNRKNLNIKIIILNVELELKSEKENCELRISHPEDFQPFVDAEWKNY